MVKNRKIGKYVTLMAVASIGIGTFLDVASGFNSVSAAETVTLLEENKATEVSFDLKKGDTTSFNFWKEDEGGKGLIRNQKYKISVEGNGQIEVYHDNETSETSDLIKVVDGKTMHLLERTFTDGDSVAIKAAVSKDFKVTFTPVSEESSETTEESSTSSSTESSSTESSSMNNSESGTTESSKTETTESSKETEKPVENKRFEWVAEKDSTYLISLPQSFMGALNKFDIKINGKAQKIKMNKDGLWLFESTNTNQLTIKLKKGDKIDASSRVSIKDMEEIHSVGIWASLKEQAVAVVNYNPKNQMLEFENTKKYDDTRNTVDTKTKLEPIKITKLQKTVEIENEIYNLTWENEVLKYITTATKDKVFYNNDFTNIFRAYAVFHGTADSLDKKINEYTALNSTDLDNLVKDYNKLVKSDKAVEMPKGFDFKYSNSNFSFAGKIGFENPTKFAYNIKLPDDFKDTAVFKQRVGEIHYQTIVQKHEKGGFNMVVFYIRINKDNTITVATDTRGAFGKGLRHADISMKFNARVEEKVTQAPKKEKTIKEEIPKTGSNLANGAVFGTAGLALSLILLIRKRFPIK